MLRTANQDAAVLPYGMGGMSFSGIGRPLGVSDVAVLGWVRAETAAARAEGFDRPSYG